MPPFAGSLTWAHALQHIELFTAIIAMSHSQYRVTVRKDTWGSREVLHCYVLSLQSHRAQLVALNGRADLPAILAPLWLLGLEIHTGNIQPFLAYLGGLRQRVGIYRDVQGMSMHDAYTSSVNYMHYVGTLIQGPSEMPLAYSDLTALQASF
jgi:hypothetical protein